MAEAAPALHNLAESCDHLGALRLLAMAGRAIRSHVDSPQDRKAPPASASFKLSESVAVRHSLAKLPPQ